jgi:hypothetical protein
VQEGPLEGRGDSRGGTLLRGEVERACETHPDRFACPDCLVHHSPKSGHYGLIVHDGGRSSLRIQFCPWCGVRLPVNKRLTSDELAALVVDALVDAGLIEKGRFGEAAEVAREEIEVRKHLGDY